MYNYAGLHNYYELIGIMFFINFVIIM